MKMRSLTLFLSPFLLCLGLVACSDDKPETEQQVPQQEARTEPLPFRMTEGKAPALPPPDGKLAADTAFSTAPNGEVAMFALESGHLVQRYEGDRTGKKELFFKDYGRYQRLVDESTPTKEADPMPEQKHLMITTPEFFGSYQAEYGQGWRVPNNSYEEEYRNSGASDSLSISEYGLMRMGAKRLPDTTINGYKTRVYRVDAGGVIHTRWIWRDLVLREHFFAPYRDIEYRIEPVSLELRVNMPDSLFKFPKGYVIIDRPSPPLPNSLPPPPVEGGR